jgi:hypothetical protein
MKNRTSVNEQFLFKKTSLSKPALVYFGMKFFYTVVFLLCSCNIVAQEKKSVQALYITEPVNIDANLDEPAYSKAQPAKDFLQVMPYNGQPSFQPSEVFFLYDQSAIYVGAILYDSSPDSIYNFFSERDNIGMSDYFGVYLDPYNQGQLAYGFFITPAGVQTDIKAVKSDNDYEDSNWDAVWQSRTRVTDKGWIVEMKIPYSALRFPENGGGTWGLNMFRNIRRYNSNNSWNFFNREISGFIHQEGELTGIQNIKPPVRLSLSPYAATYLELKEATSSSDFIYKGGMDLKYGISESFTLDMILIPDFGQIQSDDQELNLSPYELYYSEKRQFFTEGTELFEKAGIFYSRRIGAKPKFVNRIYKSMQENEIVDYSPSETQLLNTTKISGRTRNGWGLGFLNAVTLPSNAILRDTITGFERDIKVQSLTNYNVSVIDKTLKNNSYISLINSNILMADDPFRANVTATDFQIRNKAKTFAVKGKGGISTRSNDEKETGFFAGLGLEKNGGKLHYGISQNVYSDKYNPNDLGYLRRNNEMIGEVYINYNIIKPFSVFREAHATLWYDHMRMYRNASLTANQFGLNTNAQFRNNYGIQINFYITGNRNDYYEPRVPDRYYTEPFKFNYNLYGYTDMRKSVMFTGTYGGHSVPEIGKKGNWVDGYVRIRLGKKLMFDYEMYFEKDLNDRGYAGISPETGIIYFTRRDVRTVQSILGTSYAINNKAGFNLRIRHYWSGAENKDFHQLLDNGSLMYDSSYNPSLDNNYNAFNIDLTFRWIFAPGSELTLAWKNSILENGSRVIHDYLDNLSNTWKSDQTNSFSIKILYYIDYNTVINKLKK